MEWLVNKIVKLINDFSDWLFEVLQWIPKKLWEELLDALATVIEHMPVPGFVDTAHNAFTSIPSTILFFANKAGLGEGVAMILSAYVLRFLIRRIPIIG